MRRLAAVAVLLSLVAVPSAVSSSAASADVLKLACTPSQIRIQVFSEMRDMHPLPNVILFTNTKGSCFLPRHNIPVQPEKALSLIRRQAGPVSPALSLPGLVTLAHGASVRSTIQWRATAPKGWNNSSCASYMEIIGVDVRGPTSAWPMRFHRWPATKATCANFTVKLSSTVIRLGSSASGAFATPRAYAWSVLATVPMPPGAKPVNSLPAALINASGAPATVSGIVTVSRNYEVPASVDLAAYFDAHLPPNRDPGGCSTYGNNGATQYSCQRTLACANLHSTLCGASYNFETIGQQQELRVSVYVVWRPIVSASFPSGGTVTVTGYAHSSAMSGSSGPVSASPTYAQRRTLAAALAELRGAPGGICMEDGWLFTITVRSSVQGRVVWRAKADICPGTVAVSWSGHKVALNGRNCGLAHAVREVLPPAARATREYLSSCL